VIALTLTRRLGGAFLEPTAKTQKCSAAGKVTPVEETQKGGSKTEETTGDQVAHARSERLCFARVDRLFRGLTKKPKDVGLDQPNKFQFFELTGLKTMLFSTRTFLGKDITFSGSYNASSFACWNRAKATSVDMMASLRATKFVLGAIEKIKGYVTWGKVAVILKT
jgi:hypothetical protein